nr:hypothetical protein Iba_chr07aCG14650 [Ipomoea batatas]
MMGIPYLTEKLTSLPSGIDTHCPNNFSLSSSPPPSPPPPPLVVELSEFGTSPTTTSDSSHWDTLDSSNSFFLDWYTCDASSAVSNGPRRPGTLPGLSFSGRVSGAATAADLGIKTSPTTPFGRFSRSDSSEDDSVAYGSGSDTRIVTFLRPRVSPSTIFVFLCKNQDFRFGGGGEL